MTRVLGRGKIKLTNNLGGINMKKKTVAITAIAAIAAVGATIFVIKKGPALKEELLNKVDALKTKIKDIEVSEVKEAISNRLVEIKEDIKNFDWEKPKAEVEKKFYELRRKIREVKKHVPLIESKSDQDA